MEIGIKEHSSGFAWVMGNMGSPGIKDLLYPGLESHGKCGSWEAMENKVIWAVLHLQTKETGKRNLQSSKGNTVRDYFKDTVTPHFFNVAIRCIVLIKTSFSQARHPAPPSSLFLRNKMV